MNKLAKRVLAFMLMACLLIALVPAVASAETNSVSDAVVYDFELDQNPAMQWGAYDELSSTTTYYGFGQTDLPQGNPGQQAALNKWYDDGALLWNFPHSLNEDGKVANELSFGNAVENPIQWGGAYYKGGTTADKDWTGLKVSTYSEGAATGWNALLLKAPDVGTYDITVEYTKYARSSTNVGIYLLPYTAAMKEKVETDVEGWNADVSAIVAQGQGYRGKFSSWIAAGSTPVTGQIADMGQIDVEIEVDEYLLIVTSPAGKSSYLQNVTFTPVAEQEIPAETIERNYSIAGTNTGSNVVLNNTGTTSFVEDKYDAGDIDWSYLGTTANDNQILLQKGNIYTQNFYVDRTGDDNDLYAWEAFKLRSPGEGAYDISFETATGATATQKTQIWTSVYMTEYTEGMDPATVIDPANLIGTHRPQKTDATEAIVTDAVGEFTFGAANKEYIIVLHYDGDYNGTFLKPDTDYSSADPAIDCYMTMHTYMRKFIIEPQEAPITFVPKAYVGTTPYATVAAAAAAAQADDTIKLAVDFKGNIDLRPGVSLDLNGNDWTVTDLATYTASQAVIDSVGTGNLIAKNIDLFGSNANVLPLATAANTYTLADYDLVAENTTGTTNNIEQSPANAEATRFWFKLTLDDAAAYDLIAGGNSGLTIGVDLDWGAAEGLSVTFDDGDGAEAFAADWAAAAKNNSNIWLYVDITGIDALENDLTVKPILNINGQTSLYTGSLVYEIG